MSVTRLRLVAAELIRPTARSMRWAPLAGATGGAAVIAFLMTRAPDCAVGGYPCIGLEGRIQVLRIAMVLVAVGAGFALDDPARETTAHLPVSLLFRRTLRVGLMAPAIGLLWLVLVGLALRTGGGQGFPLGALTIEMAALVVTALAASAGAERFVPEGLGGVVAGPLVLGVMLAALLVPERFALLVGDPADLRWDGAHERWLVGLCAALLVLVHWSGDPGRARLLRRRRTPFTPPLPDRSEPAGAGRTGTGRAG